MSGTADETERIASILEKYGRNRKLKIRCTACGMKMDLTEPYPFEIIQCPGCHSNILRPAYFGDCLIKEKLPDRDPLTSLYLASDLKLERDILISILNPSLAERKEIADLYLETARSLALINHPSVIPIYNCGETAGLFFIVMRKTEGGTLEEFLNAAPENTIPIRRTVSWMRQIISALKKASETNLCHGLLSPRSLLPDGDETILISGFGLGALCKAAGVSPGSSCSAPEAELTPKSDVYSAGAVFFHLLAGRFPDPGEQDAPKEIRRKNPKIAGLLHAMLEPDPSARISAANALPILEQIESEFKSNKNGKQKSAPARKRLFILLVLSAVLLLAAALGLFFLLSTYR